MGDRGNILLIDTPERPEAPPGFKTTGIYVYSHWGGTNLPEELRKALIHGQGRWGDDSYLARIIIDQVLAPERDELTGAGISTMLTDNEHDILIVDLVSQTVSIAPEGFELNRDAWEHTQSFEEYISGPRTWHTIKDAA